MTNVSKREVGVADGLRSVAHLIDRGIPAPLTWGTVGVPLDLTLSSYGRERDEIVSQALMFIGMLTAPPAFEVRDGTYSGVWLSITGRVYGLYVVLQVNAEAVCDKRVTGIHQATDGSIHEITRWVIPDEILTAWTGREPTASGEDA